jgi:ATP-dependent Zn protease
MKKIIFIKISLLAEFVSANYSYQMLVDILDNSLTAFFPKSFNDSVLNIIIIIIIIIIFFFFFFFFFFLQGLGQRPVPVQNFNF